MLEYEKNDDKKIPLCYCMKQINFQNRIQCLKML